jgi:hypothetical protein
LGTQYELDKYGIRLDVDNAIEIDRDINFNQDVTFDKMPLFDGNQIEQVARVALTALDTGGGIFAWANPEGVAIIVTGLFFDLTTVATGACTLDAGTTATSATTVSDNLIDGLDINSATGLFDNFTDKGTNGKSRQKLAAGKWVTGSMKTGAAAGTAGYAYIRYVRISPEA